MFSLAMMCRLQYMCVTAFTLPGAALERIFSMVLVDDYEEKARSRISLFITAAIDLVTLTSVVSSALAGEELANAILMATVILIALTNAFAIFVSWVYQRRDCLAK